MVFETIPDKVNMRSEEEKMQEMISNKSQVVNSGNVKGDVEQLEMDNVNKHECMKNIKRCIDKMQELFSANWESDQSNMPLFMQALNAEVKRPDTHINIKIFILKILINK